jgi:nuclear transport factor 2 (NTF2) superfamily protein
MQKVRLAEDGWNSRDADKVSLAYSLDTQWRNRAEFTNGRRKPGSSWHANGTRNSSTA